MSELRHDEGFFSAKDGLRLFWRSDVPADPAAIRAHVLFVHGYADHAGRHKNAIGHLVANGFAVHAFDYRGHGQSDGRRGHVERFDDFQSDLQTYLELRVRSAAGTLPLFVVAHSHGALIAARWAFTRPEGIAGFVFSAPLFGLAFKPPAPKLLAARLIGKLVPWFPFSNELKPEQLSRDPDAQKATLRDPLYVHHTTPGWFFQAMAAWQEVLRRASEFQYPLLQLHSPVDPINDFGASREFFERASSADKTFKTCEGMMHEVFNDTGREQVLAWVSDWLRERTPARAESATSP
ncbi:MAG: lysophospholipase [Myxococcales bacterium]